MSRGVYIPGPTIFQSMADKTNFMKGFDAAKNALKKLKTKVTKKRVQRGLLGKAGAVTIGVVPLAAATLEAASAAQNSAKIHDLSMLGTLSLGVNRWVNDMSKGLIGMEAFDEPMQYGTNSGTVKKFNTGAGLPAFSLLKVIATGGTMMAADYFASFFSGNRAVMIPQTRIAAIGSH